ncbi:MAG: type II toxin-antitoxin system VapC family toxin [Chitinophagaceae bacterium]|nr:MAG: type II toxin-antitoxin system VapC family toxin [Chitinophagaceae bacterium]
MNGPKYLLDTNIILYILGGNETLANHLHQKSLYASFVSEIELLSFGRLTAREEKNIKEFLQQFRIIDIDQSIKQEAISLRKTYNLKLPDCIIAATAITLQLTLITADKQYRQIENLHLELVEF